MSDLDVTFGRHLANAVPHMDRSHERTAHHPPTNRCAAGFNPQPLGDMMILAVL
jgi:hypothetical protein